MPLVSVVLVSFDSREQLPNCLMALARQTYRTVEVLVVDNASQDGSVDLVRELAPSARVMCHSYNRGFCAAFNLGVELSRGEFVLSLNPDVVLEPDFIAELAAALTDAPDAGMSCGKLLRPTFEGGTRVMDSAGLAIRADRRVRDRGAGEPDDGRFDEPGEVFGACGAAALYRRRMLDDVAVKGEYLSETLFAYWDDVDLSWRARRRGWRCLYVPSAVGYHVRGGAERLSSRGRDRRATEAQMLGLRNRYLVLARNEEILTLAALLPRLLLSDVPRWAYVLVRRPGLLRSLPSLGEALPDALEQRRIILSSGKARGSELRKWMGGRAR